MLNIHENIVFQRIIEGHWRYNRMINSCEIKSDFPTIVVFSFSVVVFYFSMEIVRQSHHLTGDYAATVQIPSHTDRTCWLRGPAAIEAVVKRNGNREIFIFIGV